MERIIGKTATDEPQYTGKNTDFYVADAKVAETVNLAVDLKRPILVEGEPGCGKTMLAYSIAAEKQLGEVVKIVVRSTSRAQDLLYRVNSLRRLQDAQNPHNQKAQFVYPYLSLGDLGAAIHEKKRRVLLIDEIDKADIDFPNDLLDVLDKFSFSIDDLPAEEAAACLAEKGFGRKIVADAETQPIVIITSNREKRLPEPFLRRCLFVRLNFPKNAAELRDIVRKNTKLTVAELNAEILAAAVDSFVTVRKLSLANNAEKPPTTGELIDWVKILFWKGKTAADLTANSEQPPYWELLFKNMNDIESYQAATARAKE